MALRADGAAIVPAKTAAGGSTARAMTRAWKCSRSLCGNRGCAASFAELWRGEPFTRKLLLGWESDPYWVDGGGATQFQVDLQKPAIAVAGEPHLQLAKQWQVVQGHARNSISTAVYTWWNFAALSILFQFKKAANVWFAVHVSLMMFGQYDEIYLGVNFFDTSMSPFSTGSLLLMMLLIVSVVDLFGELTRRAADLKVNTTKAQVVAVAADGTAAVEVRPWSAVRVGDLVKLESADSAFKMLPADIALLASSKVGGVVNVETSGIDGETSLKTMRPNGDEGLALCRELQGVKQGAPASAIKWTATLANVTQKFRACIEYEVPDKSVETFNGSLTYSIEARTAGGGRGAGDTGPRGQTKHEVNLRGGKGGQLLLRGSSLMQTQWALGVVIYTGNDTKLRMNSRPPAAKYSAVNRVIDQTLIIVALAEICIVLVSVAAMVVWNAYEVDPDPSVWWYLDLEVDSMVFPSWLASLFTFQILYNYMIPISMYAMIEIVNSGQALMIAHDVEMQSWVSLFYLPLHFMRESC